MILIAASIIVLAILPWYISPAHIHVHNVLHHLNFLPLMVAGMVFGWRGALIATLFAAIAQAPNIVSEWAYWPIDASDQIIEMSIFGAAGLIAGFLSDRERSHRHKLEFTTRKLEALHEELRQNVDRVRKSERLSTAGRLAASLAHEIRNPLASIWGAAGILKRGQVSSEYMLECLDIIVKESQRLNKLLSGFLDFARPRLPRLQRTNVAALIDSVISLARHAAILDKVELQHLVAEGVSEIECDPEQLKQVLLNLLINAVQATSGNGVVWIRSYVAAGHLCVEVCDDGCGIDPEQQDKIFDPFFTTKETGTGLGLAVAAMLVQQHGGLLTGSNNASGGMTFRLEMPVPQEQQT
jgi:signal transduction histidine kinase